MQEITAVDDITGLLQRTKEAANTINRLPDAERRQLTGLIADAIMAHTSAILAANATDLARMEPANPMYDRLLLTESRLAQVAAATRQVAQLPDPTNVILSSQMHPKGMLIEKHTVPLGVVGAIYEARPNVTIDIAALCLRSGNAAVLKGGTDAADTNACLVKIMHQVLQAQGLPAQVIALLPNQRQTTTQLLHATRLVDVIVPRGSQGLIDYVRKNATVPVIETGAGVCHTYVHHSANLPMAASIVVNAKTQRPSVCNALDTILVDESVAVEFLPLLVTPFLPFEVGVYACSQSLPILQHAQYPYLYPATAEHYGREYLSQNCSIKVVANLQEALAHIAAHSSRHSEAIVCQEEAAAEIFLATVDAAAVYHNASTRFTDGGEFGLGAELGISTQKLHARGPFALEKLVCEKWIVRGNGQVR